MSKNLVIVFVKEPTLGFVKTRLAKKCGDEFTLSLYKFFVKDLIHTLSNKSYDLKLCAYPNLDLVKQIFGDYNNFLQVDGDLGIKMCEAFKNQFQKAYDKIVLIGSDTPHITNDIVLESFEKLNSNDVVLGPSLDGGYYLIAFNKYTFNKNVFENISWSTPKVLNQTLQKLHEKNVYLLSELNDIDVLEDLTDFYETYQNSFFKDSYTLQFLKETKSWKNLMS